MKPQRVVPTKVMLLRAHDASTTVAAGRGCGTVPPGHGSDICLNHRRRSVGTIEMLSVLFGFTIIAGIVFVVLDQMGIWKNIPGVRSRAERQREQRDHQSQP